MIIESETNDKIINFVTQLFENTISHQDLRSYYEIGISNDITKDVLLFDKNVKSNNEFAGFTILPSTEFDKIQILISYKSITPDVIAHELAHMYDMVLFAKYFCNSNLYKIKESKYFQTFIYWTEFHVKQVDIPITQVCYDILEYTAKNDWLNDFKIQISNYFYPQYTQKFLAKNEVEMRDIMWYLGEIAVCNLYDDNNTYEIPQDVIDIYGERLLQLNQHLLNCINFEGFAENITSLHQYFLDL